ncbi:MAG: hypothetical protein IMF15_09200 [Proteobacteria bacterium]|nr:hypothetical protein [Pseudomonadota bacterium]
MNDESSTEPKSAQSQNSGNNQSSKKPSDFVAGLVTFIIFIFFMTAWMYFSG